MQELPLLDSKKVELEDVQIVPGHLERTTRAVAN